MNEPIISPWVVYLITRLDSIRDLLCGVVFLSIFFPFVFMLVSELFEPDNADEELKRCVKMAVVAAVTAGVCLTFLPTTKEVIVIYASSKVTLQTMQDTGEAIDKAIDRVVEKIMTLEKQGDK